MKNLFDQSRAKELHERLGRLTPDSKPEWGKMNVAQALAHVAGSFESALGDQKPTRMFVGRIIGPAIKRLALGDDKPIKKNSPTSPELVISNQRDFNAERQRLDALISRFATSGPAGCTSHPHSFFGKLTPDEWAVLTYKHTDHHLRQFGV